MNTWEYVAMRFRTACDKDGSYVITRSAILGLVR